MIKKLSTVIICYSWLYFFCFQSVQSVTTQVPYQTICFVTKLSKQDFIAADAIAKLRQVCLSSYHNVNKILVTRLNDLSVAFLQISYF